jgi:pilus assembly protein CpaE
MARRAYDYVIVDTFPLIDAVVMAILDLSDLTYFVMQGTVPNVVGAARHLEILERVGFPKERVKIVLSRNHPSFSGNLKPRDIERRLGRPIDHIVPYSRKILVSINTGHPFILRTTRIFGFGRAIRKIEDEVTGRRTAPPPAPLGEEIETPGASERPTDPASGGIPGESSRRADATDAEAEQTLRDKVRAWRS